MKVATVNFELTIIKHADDFFSHLINIITTAAGNGSELIVLPEYTVAELYSVVPAYAESRAPYSLVQFAASYLTALQGIADKHSVTIIGGTYFDERDGKLFNICPIITPQKSPIFQVKNRLVTYEREVQHLSQVDKIVPLHLPEIGVLICYDSEFPEFVRTHCERGVLVLCVPSSMDTVHGFNRVRYSCLARAIENQIFVVHSALVGSIGKEPITTSYGSSAIIAPCAPEFNSGPILAETKLNTEDIAYAVLDFEALKQFRTAGEVQNWNDRPRKS